MFVTLFDLRAMKAATRPMRLLSAASLTSKHRRALTICSAAVSSLRGGVLC